MKIPKKELLAPAGNYESFLAALQNGADAIYLSGTLFGARKFAKNFTNDELKQAIFMGHLYGVKVYITMNTMVKEREVEAFLAQVSFLYQLGVDAILMQDIGMICLCREMFPELEIHASTQVNNSTKDTIRLLEKIGVKRVVFPREMTLSEIASIKTTLEKEVFIHGALCVSYSGNCLMSFLNGGRSANRGACAGCCRLFYRLYQDGKKQKEGYLLSMKELHTAPFFKDILESDIRSLKIEGRMKSPSYVACVTRYYRKRLDGEIPSSEDLDALKTLFYRQFTKGHLLEDTRLVNSKQPNHIGLLIGTVEKVTKEKIKIRLKAPLYQEDGIRFLNSKKGLIVNFLYNEKGKLVSSLKKGEVAYLENTVQLKETDEVYKTSSKQLQKELLAPIRRTVPICIMLTAKIGFPLKLCLMDRDGNQVMVEGTIVEKATSCAISFEKITQLLTRLKDTPFQEEKVNLYLDRDLFIRVGEINALRREAVQKLIEKRTEVSKRRVVTKLFFTKYRKVSKKEMTAFVKSEETLKRALAEGFTRIYVKDYDLYKKYQTKKGIFYVLLRNQLERSEQSKFILTQELRKASDQMVGGYALNVANAYSAYYLVKLGYQSVFLSVELEDLEIEELLQSVDKHFGYLPLEILVKGAVESMVIKGNPLQIRKGEMYQLKDNNGHVYPVVFEKGTTLIYSPYQVDKTREIAKWNEKGITAFCKIIDE